MPGTRVAAALALQLAFAGGLLGQVRIGDVYYFERAGGPGSGGSSVTALAEENAESGAGGLTWACEDRAQRVTLSTTFLGRGLRARVRWAFDDGPPSETGAWALSTTGMAATAPPDVAVEFTRRAAAARRVRLEVSDFQYRRIAYTFGLSGLAEALALLPCAPGASAPHR